jgi:hypothetical protein
MRGLLGRFSITCSLIGAALLFLFGVEPASAEKPADSWSVLTVNTDGSWGVGYQPKFNRALAEAIANCKSMSHKPLGCGARFEAVQQGWTLLLRCGEEYIIAAESTLREAELVALDRARDIRQNYDAHLPECQHVVEVDVQGNVIVLSGKEIVTEAFPAR